MSFAHFYQLLLRNSKLGGDLVMLDENRHPLLVSLVSFHAHTPIGFIWFTIVLAVKWRLVFQKCIWASISFRDDAFFFLRKNEIEACSIERGFAHHPF
ncbi:MAG: hypothetical protein AAF217_14635 [Pseudomonadota bacterium]